MAIDLKAMTRKELEKHLKDVKSALVSAQARDRRQAKKAAAKAAAEFGFSLSDLADEKAATVKPRRKKTAGPKKKSKPVYANPSDPSQTWTGKGRRPAWFVAAVESGTSENQLKI